MEKLLETYKSTDNTELEIRLDNVSRELFIKLVKQYPNGYINQSVNFIDKDKKKYKIKQINFKDGKSIGSSFMQKKKLNIVKFLQNESLPYKVALSEELDIPDFKPSSNALIRIKNRYSIVVDYWKYDFTVTRQFTKQTPQIKQIIKETFAKKQHYLDTINFELLEQKYEIEIEHIDNNETKNNLNILDIDPYKLLNIQKEDTNNSNNLLFEIATLLKRPNPNLYKSGRLNIKQLTQDVITLNKNNYQQIYPPINYFAMDKTDGLRSLTYINNNVMHIIDANEVQSFEFDKKIEQQPIIADGELTNGKFYIFDVLMFNSELIIVKPYSERIDYITKIGKLSSIVNFDLIPKNIKRLELATLEQIFTEINTAKYDYEIDGIIITEPDSMYYQTKSYKWKPITTIDFLVVKCPDKLIGVKPYINKPNHTLHLLFNGINRHQQKLLKLQFMPRYDMIFGEFPSSDYYPIQFSPSNMPNAYLWHVPNSVINSKNLDLDKHVVELKYTNNTWEFVTFRKDKENHPTTQYGNNFRVAELNWLNIIDMMTLDDLWLAQSIYFGQSKNGIYFAPVGFNSFIKSQILKDIQNKQKILDLAGGKGQDLFRYQSNKVQEILFLDKDKVALAEIINRKYDMVKSKNIKEAKKRKDIAFKHKKFTKFNPNNPMAVYIMHADLTSSSEQIIFDIQSRFDSYQEKSVDLIVCHFAIHYILSSAKQVNNFANIVSHFLKKDGLFVYTCFDGQKIINLLGDTDEWNSMEDTVTKYSIKKEYEGSILTDYSQQIGVKLPFSLGEYYSEYLVNLDVVNKQFGKKNLKLVKSESFSEMLPLFEQSNPKVYSALTQEDIKYVSLYSLNILQKI